MPHHRYHAQRGMTAVLFMLLSALSLGAMVFGAAYYVRGAQSQSVTVHALTQAQLKAWSGVEALRQYLFTIGAAEAAKLTANQAVTLTGATGISATVASVQANDSVQCGGGTRVNFNVTGSSGGANALLAAVYCAKGNAGGSTSTEKNVVGIKGDLDLTGDLKVIGGDKARIVIDGNVSGAGSLTGFSYLYATGNVSMGGATNFETLVAEGDVSLSGSGLYSSISSLKSVTLTGGVQAGTINANGNVTLASNTVTELNSGKDVVLGAVARVTTLRAKGNVSSTDGVISGTALVQGNYRENNQGSVASGQYGGSLTVTQPSNTKVNMTRTAGLVVNVTEVKPAIIAAPGFDAFAYKSLANYIFERSGSDTRVTVKNVSGVPDGSYILSTNADKRDYLCSSSTYDASCKPKICQGYSDWNSCFSYNAGSKTWSVAGVTMAPGIVWFDGNLVAGEGTYHNTWIASGNLQTAGNNISYAVNWAGYAQTCNNSTFPTLKPSNFCKSGSAELQYVAAGNIVFGAGGKPAGGAYAGGKIDLSASVDVYGDVLAGDILKTGGNTKVRGHISAAKLGNNPGNSGLGASTTIDMSNLPSTFKPGDNAPTPAVPNSATLLWSRYR